MRWSYLSDWEESTGLVFDKTINKQLLFRINNGISWQKKTQLFSFGHGYSLYHQLSSSKALVYFSNISGIHEPKIHSTGYELGVGYRQMIYNNWIFLEISPKQETKLQTLSFRKMGFSELLNYLDFVSIHIVHSASCFIHHHSY